ncbi:MAG: manganese efflux pump [Clostridia bacterium]|nr:manganese efflux pump [Clostridia bacterium]
MEPLAVIMVAVALGTDAFSLAAGLALGGLRGSRAVYFTAIVGFFHIIMPLAGLYLGLLMGRLLGRLAAIIGAVLLAAIGGLMLREAFIERREAGGLASKILCAVPGQVGVIGGLGAIALMAGSVSLDALSVGFGLGAISVNLPLTVLTMGFIAALMTALGFLVGQCLGDYLGARAEIFGGLILITIGILMLLEV